MFSSRCVDNKSDQHIRSQAKTAIFHLRNIAKVTPVKHQCIIVMNENQSHKLSRLTSAEIRYNLFRDQYG